MKRVISLTILIVMVVLGMQFFVTFFTKKHAYQYVININEDKYSIIENYIKDNGDTYDIEINDGSNSFYYAIANNFNKQKKIVTNIEVFKDGDNTCIYPVLKDNIPSYIECSSNGKLYNRYTYYNQDFINAITNSLIEKGYYFQELDKNKGARDYSNVVLYTNYLKPEDTILLWQYKGILILNNEMPTSSMNLSFDKYENKLGCLVGRYYVFPNYTNKNILEFSSITVIDLMTTKQTNIELGCILSSGTYLNGVVDNKIYYTDPSNLLQVEVNPKKKSYKVIGNTDMNGKKYSDGKWESANIYDFASNQIKFDDLPNINFTFKYLIEGGSSYYFYTSDGSIYQLLKKHLDKPILIFKANDISNFQAVGEDVFYVSGNTLYSFNNNVGNYPLMVDNDLIYNNLNRISIYRKR